MMGAEELTYSTGVASPQSLCGAHGRDFIWCVVLQAALTSPLASAAVKQMLAQLQSFVTAL